MVSHRRIRFKKPYRFTPGIKGFFSLKYKKKFLNYNEFSLYDRWQKRKQAIVRYGMYEGRSYVDRLHTLKAISRPHTKYFRHDNY